MSQDIFAAPRADVRDVSGGRGAVSDSVLASLRKTRPWVLLIAVLGFIGTAFIAIAAVSILAGGAMMGQVAGLGDNGAAALMGSGAMMGVGVLYLLMALIYFFVSLYLLRYASAIKRLSSSMSLPDLESALNHQASFWKLAGILALISIVLMVLGMVAAIAIPLFMGHAGG